MFINVLEKKKLMKSQVFNGMRPQDGCLVNMVAAFTHRFITMKDVKVLLDMKQLTGGNHDRMKDSFLHCFID